jgi:hypothetical protein
MSCVIFNKREPNKRFLNVPILGSIMHQMNSMQLVLGKLSTSLCDVNM